MTTEDQIPDVEETPESFPLLPVGGTISEYELPCKWGDRFGQIRLTRTWVSRRWVATVHVDGPTVMDKTPLRITDFATAEDALAAVVKLPQVTPR